jgi:hypothetical protein
MYPLSGSRCSLRVCVVAVLLAGCGQTNSMLPQSKAGAPALGMARAIPGSTRGTNCIFPSETKRRIDRWARFRFGHCANGSFIHLPADWSSSGGDLRVFHQREDARFTASSPGTYTITASCCGGSWQSTAIVRQ